MSASPKGVSLSAKKVTNYYNGTCILTPAEDKDLFPCQKGRNEVIPTSCMV